MNAEDVYECECKADNDTCYVRELGLGCNAEDSKNEDECEQNLDEDRQQNVAVIKAVCTKAAVKAEHNADACSTNDTAEELSYNLSAEILCCHLT